MHASIAEVEMQQEISSPHHSIMKESYIKIDDNVTTKEHSKFGVKVKKSQKVSESDVTTSNNLARDSKTDDK